MNSGRDSDSESDWEKSIESKKEVWMKEEKVSEKDREAE